MYSLVAGDGALGGGVGGLEPLITVTQPVGRLNLRIADFEVEVSLSISVVFQSIQDRKQIGLGVVRILGQGILWAGEQSSSCIVAEYLRP